MKNAPEKLRVGGERQIDKQFKKYHLTGVEIMRSGGGPGWGMGLPSP